MDFFFWLSVIWILYFWLFSYLTFWTSLLMTHLFDFYPFWLFYLWLFLLTFCHLTFMFLTFFLFDFLLLTFSFLTFCHLTCIFSTFAVLTSCFWLFSFWLFCVLTFCHLTFCLLTLNRFYFYPFDFLSFDVLSFDFLSWNHLYVHPFSRYHGGIGSPPPPPGCGGYRNSPGGDGLTLAGTGHFASFHGTRGGGVGTTPPCRFAPDWARASRKNKRVARRETKRLIYKLKVLGQPVTSEVRSSAEIDENPWSPITLLLMELEQNFNVQRVPCDD